MKQLIRLTGRQVRPHFKMVNGSWCLFWRGASGTLYLNEHLHFMTFSSRMAHDARAYLVRLNTEGDALGQPFKGDAA